MSIVADGQGTIYLGGGNWGTPHSNCQSEDGKPLYYISKWAKENHVWLMNIKATNHIIGAPTIQRQIFSIKSNGEVIDTFGL